MSAEKHTAASEAISQRQDEAPPHADQPQHAAEQETIDYPEGGMKAWAVVFGSFCIMFSAFGVVNTAAVFESYYTKHQLRNEKPSTVAWIFSLYLFTLYFLGLPIGPIFDKYGHRALVLAGSILAVASPMILSICSEYYQIILTFSVLSGIGNSFMNTPAYAVVGHWFNKRRGLATGIVASAGSLGGVVFPLVLRTTLTKFGYAWSMRIMGFILLLLAIPPNLLLHTRLPPSQRFSTIRPDVKIFRDPKLSLCCVGIFFMEYGVLIPLTYISSYASEHGLNINDSYVLPALLNAGSVLGRILPGILADKIGRFNTLIMTVGLCAISVFALWLPAAHSESTLITFTIILGFASGGNVSLIPVCIGQLCDSRDYGRYLSTAMLIASFGTLTGIPIGGAIVGIGGSRGWLGLILFSGFSYLVSVASYVAARVFAVGWDVGAIY